MRLAKNEYLCALQACSACAGNYEDPDRTVALGEEPDEEAEWETLTDFPSGGEDGRE